jgi:hypothetical protein
MSSLFTVGDTKEIQELEALICTQGPHLIEADGGCGKSHLLDHIREKALEQRFVVSLVRLDSREEVRFNRLDQVLGAVFRGLEVPEVTDGKGVQAFMDTLCGAIEDSRLKSLGTDFWWRLTNEWKWHADNERLIESPALYIALRAWYFGPDDRRRLVEDWLGHPWRYHKDRKGLAGSLIEDLRPHFLDPRPPSVLFSNKDRIFHFKEPEYVQSWSALRDIERLATAAGFKGLVLLFDEMDDIHDKLGNLRFLKIALANLLRFLQPESFNGKSFFAVDTEFDRKCRDEFARKRQGDYDLSRLDEIPRFRISRLGEEDLAALAGKIVQVHALGYGWTPNAGEIQQEVGAVVRRFAGSATEHGPRQVVRAVVEYLDERRDAAHE